MLYLNDFIILFRYVEEHLHREQTLLRLLSGASESIRQWFLLEDHTRYLNHFLRPGQLDISMKEHDAIRSLRHPAKGSECRLFRNLREMSSQTPRDFALIAAQIHYYLKIHQGSTLNGLGTLSLSRSENYNIDCGHHQYGIFKNRHFALLITSMNVTGKAIASYCRSSAGDMPSTLHVYIRSHS